MDAMINVDHVEETAEGLLRGGFAIIGGEDGISPLSNFLGLCHNTADCGCNTCNTSAGCGGPTSKEKGNGVINLPPALVLNKSKFGAGAYVQ